MLQQPIYSLFIRLIPEAFLIMYAIYLLTNSNINFKKIFISGILGGIGAYIVRLLPIHFGVHTILAIMVDILLAVKFNNIEIHKAIASSLISVILIFMSDIILFTVYINIFHLSSDVIFGQTLLSVIAGVPSLLIFYIIIKVITYYRGKGTKYE